jgi:hypothetical protein
LAFFHSFFSHYNLFGIHRRNISVGVCWWIQWRNILWIKFTVIYCRKNFIGVSVCICKFSNCELYNVICLIFCIIFKIVLWWIITIMKFNYIISIT